MTEFERNQLDLIRKQIDEIVKHPKIGVVTQVYEHSAEDDASNYEVDVDIDRGTSKEQRVPVHTPSSGVSAPPKNGDKIILIYVEGNTKRPVAFGTGWSATDRPPAGRAGMYRNSFESGSSPAGDGNLYITGYTSYDESVASNDKRDLSPEETFVQIAKHAEGENVDPSTASDIPAKIEMYDSPSTDESWISVEINRLNGGSSDATWGIKFNLKTGELKLVDPSGYGIVSDGDGNFTWEYESKTENQVSGGGSLSL